MLDKIKYHIKYQEVNNRLLSLESFCLHHNMRLEDLESHSTEYEYLKMAVKHHLMEKSLTKVYNHNVAVTLLDITNLEDRLNELEKH